MIDRADPFCRKIKRVNLKIKRVEKSTKEVGLLIAAEIL
jgi:hypothetical protein